jgi:DNA-binding transcriptional LysR family regulator
MSSKWNTRPAGINNVPEATWSTSCRKGDLLYARARQILNDVREAEGAIGSGGETPRGRMKVSLPTVFGRHVIVPTLPKFIAAYPEVEVDLWMDDRIVDVVAEGFDFALLLGRLSESRLLAREVTASESSIPTM